MKDLYSFHLNPAELDSFYEEVGQAYQRIFDRCGIGDRTFYTAASGGAFSKYSHEFQTLTENGEDTIYIVPGTKFAINKEILSDTEALRDLLPTGVTVEDLQQRKAIEVGNIFKLGTRFSDAFGLAVSTSSESSDRVTMGCYGLGSTRLLGTIVECLSDASGIVWPKEVAPYTLHLVSLGRSEEEQRKADEIYHALIRSGIEVLYDDRSDVQAGQKFAESDLLGVPTRIVVSKRSLEQGGVEVKRRTSNEQKVINLDLLLSGNF